MTWLVLVAVIVVACAILAVAIAVIVGRLGGIPRPDLRRGKRAGGTGTVASEIREE